MPGVTEVIYSNGLFVAIRYFLDYTIGLLPFPFTFALFFILLFILGRRVWKRIRNKEKRPLLQRLKAFGYSVAAVIGGAIFFFMFLWGFNYARLSLEEKTGLNVTPLSLEELKQEADEVLAIAAQRRAAIPNVTDSALTANDLPGNLENEMRLNLEVALRNQGYSGLGEVRCRMIEPKGFMRGLGIQGIYNPFTGEGNVDAAADPRNLPFTMAHEMAHGYGFTDEGTCNYLAFQACIASDDPYIQYCAWEVLLRYLRSELRELDYDYYEAFLAKMPVGIQADRRHTIQLAEQHPMWFENFSRGVNDLYLKTQGVEEGTKSYDRLVSMVAAWRRSY